MKHAVLLFSYNQVDLTRQAVESILRQDIGEMDITLVDNGSTDGTREYFRSVWADENSIGKNRVTVGMMDANASPVVVANRCLQGLFARFEKVLCVANDVILPPNFYRLLNDWPVGLVTATMTSEKNFPIIENPTAVSANTPMAVGLLRKFAYDAVVSAYGCWLDEGFHFYASDCDLALRLCACGIRGVQLDLPYWHYSSATWKLAPEAERQQMLAQADRDREYFRRKWGFRVDEQAYVDSAHDLNFKGVPKGLR